MFIKNERITEYLKECAVLKESINEISVLNDDHSRLVKIFNISKLKERIIRLVEENYSLLREISVPFVVTSQMDVDRSLKYLLLERCYFYTDLKELIKCNSVNLSKMSSIMIKLSDILMILCECGIKVSNVKSSNIIYENNEMKLVDLCLNKLRRSEDMRMDEICYRSPEELNGRESNEKSVIWSLGCILYEMLTKKLPFNEENNMNKTLNNILKCKLNDDIKVDDEMMKEVMLRMLKVRNEDRLSLIEFNKEMMKENEILRDSENNVMMIEERKEILFNGDYSIEISPFNVKAYYYVNHNRWKKIRNIFIKSYNNKPNDRILSILLMMKLYKKDRSIEKKLKYQLYYDINCIEMKLDELLFLTCDLIENLKYVTLKCDGEDWIKVIKIYKYVLGDFKIDRFKVHLVFILYLLLLCLFN